MKFSTEQEKIWLVLAILFGWGNLNLVARFIDQPSIERGAIMWFGIMITGLVLRLKPETF